MTLPDNRLRFSATRTDFEAEVGLTGQAHDSYPESGAQLRFDHMRMYLIALLANQSGYEAPAQYRDGTLWMDLNSPATLKINLNGLWVPLSDVLQLATGVSLSQWYTQVQSTLSGVASQATFSGTASATITTLQLPTAVRESAALTNARALVYKNGLLLDPRKCRIVGGDTLQLVGESLERGDTYTVLISNIPEANFVA